MKKSGANFLILNLILSIIAFSFLLSNIEVVSAKVYTIGGNDYTDAEIREIFGDQTTPIDELAKRLEIIEADYRGPAGEGVVSGKEPSGAPEPTKITGAGKTPTAVKTYIPKKITPTKLNNGKETVVESFSKNPDGKTWTVNYKGGVDKAVTTETMQKELKLVDAKGEAIGNVQQPAQAPTGSKAGDWLSKQGIGSGTSNFVGHIASGLVWATTVYGIMQMVGGMVSDNQAMIDALSTAGFWGIMSGKSTYGLIKQGGWLESWGAKLPWGTPGAWSTGMGIGVAAIIFYTTYKKESQKIVTYHCYPWEAPVGGKYCEQCNQQGDFPCSEYQCKSLGQACQLLNPGTDEEKCVWINRHDVKYPIIQPWDDALLEGYVYKPHKTVSPPDRGVIVWNQDSTTGCAKAFTPLSFGITTDEPAKCKLDYLRKPGFDEMAFYFGGSSLFKYNHTQVMSLPGPSNLASENLTLENDGEFEVYVRCQDANGNHNTANFVFKYCVEKGPDTTPPMIVTTNLLNGMPIAYNQTSVDIEVYTNEPTDCKWSHLDKSYNDMEEDMSCSSSILEMNAQMLYKCSTTLTGLKNRQENKFYFRCKDQPTGVKDEDRNVNSESYEFTLIGTQPLIIDYVKPNATIKDSTETIKVTLEAKTSAGYNEGEATCYYSHTEDEYIMFFYESGTDNLNHQHSQELWLPEGEYEYFIKCIDLGGNSDTKIASFKVESDSSAPIVVRAYKEETYLKLITNEPAECVYDTVDCSYLFDDGTKITVVDDASHFTDWNTDIDLYVKCQDEYGNQPMPNQCSIVVRPFEVYKSENL